MGISSMLDVRLKPVSCCQLAPQYVVMGHGVTECTEIECSHCSRMIRVPGRDRNRAVLAWNAVVTSDAALRDLPIEVPGTEPHPRLTELSRALGLERASFPLVIEHIRRLRDEHNVMRQQPQPFSILGSMDTECSALMLGSFLRTHRHFFEFHSLEDDHSLGIRVATAHITHRPSGLDYVVAVAADHSEGKTLPTRGSRS